jgi:hypothetical protein
LNYCSTHTATSSCLTCLGSAIRTMGFARRLVKFPGSR